MFGGGFGGFGVALAATVLAFIAGLALASLM